MAEPRHAGGQGARHGHGRRRKGSRLGRFVKRTAFALLILVLVLAIAAGVGAIVFYNRTNLPDPNKDFQTNTSFIYFNDSKTKLGSLSVQNRQTISYEQMPDSIKDAAISAENRTFWEDQGISIGGIVRAAWTIARGGEMQGGSTITQQYIKILYLSQDRTMQRKLKELVLAVKMGKQVPKEDILAGYLNTIYFGRGAYGIEAAAKSYFNVPASKLTVPQSAVLASILNNPTLFDPSSGAKARERLLNRYRYVLDGMLEEGKITQTQHDEYYRKLPDFPEVPINNRWSGTNGYLLKMVQNELLDRGFTDSQINGGGLKVTTTFDSAAQKAAVATGQRYKKIAGANAGANGAKNLHPAIASVKVGTGEVLALYGGDDYISSTRSWALQARPAASTFKTYAVVAGMRNGFSLKSRLNGDTFTPEGDSVPIRNEFSEQYGDVTLQKATEDSINTAFVDMMTQMDNGPSAMVTAANDAGVPKGSGWDLNNRMPLGVAEVSPLDQATGYATLANEGKYVPSHVVAKVTDSSGKTLYTASTKGKQTIEKDIAHDTTYALENVVNEGTGSAVSNLGYPVAGKTGTNGVKDDITSAWFVAYTRQISTAVMYVAGDGGNSDLDPYAAQGDSTFFGGTYPARTWAAYMQVAMKGLPAKEFPDPDWVNLSGNHYGDTERETMTTPTPTPTPTQAPTTPTQAPTTPTQAPTTVTATATQPTQQPTTQPPATVQPTQEPTTSTATNRPTSTATNGSGGDGGGGDGGDGANAAPGGNG